jgi:hypothetical protein
MTNLEITKENVLEAHKAGCADVKKVLENLFPEVFEDFSSENVTNDETQIRLAVNIGIDPYYANEFLKNRTTGNFKDKSLYLCRKEFGPKFRVITDDGGCQVLTWTKR